MGHAGRHGWGGLPSNTARAFEALQQDKSPETKFDEARAQAHRQMVDPPAPPVCGAASTPAVQPKAEGAPVADDRDPKDVEFGKKLVAWREAQGMTPAELAEAAGTRVPTVSGWERGERQCREPLRSKVEALMLGKAIPRDIGPPAGVLISSETVKRVKLTLSEDAFVDMLRLPSGDEVRLKVFDSAKKLIGLPFTIEAEIVSLEEVPEAPKAAS